MRWTDAVPKKIHRSLAMRFIVSKYMSAKCYRISSNDKGILSDLSLLFFKDKKGY